MISSKTIVRKNEDIFREALLYLAEGKSVKLRIHGNSMFPLLRSEKDEVVLCRVDVAEEKLHNNQIVLYKRENGQYVLHRIVKVHGSYIDLRGDAQKVIERNVPVEAVLGKVTQIVRSQKIFSVDSIRQKIYFFFWSLLLPIRGRLVRWTSKI